MQRHRVQIAALLLLLVSALLLAASLRKTPQPTLSVATNVWPGYEPLYLARDLELWDANQVRLVECSSATQVMRLFRNGTVDVAALTLDETLTLVQSGVDLRVFLVTDVSNGADAILGQEDVSDFAALEGRRVGVESTALGAYMLARACQQAEVDLSTLEIIPLEVHEQGEAFRSKRVAGVVTFEPVRSQLLANGAKVLFSSEQIPGEVVDVLVARPDVLAAREAELRLLIRAWYKALGHLRAQPEDATERMAARLDLSPGDVLESFEGLEFPSHADNLELLSGSSPTLLATAQRLRDLMLDHELLQESFSLETLLDASALTGTDSDQ